MHKLSILPTIVASLVVGALPAYAASATVTPPKLLVVIVIDGLPTEQLTRYRDQFGQGGLRRLLDEGTSFSNAHQAHGSTVTAVGHAAIMSGAYPNQHGIIGNNWIAPGTMRNVYCTEDTNHSYIGEDTKSTDGTSPALLRVDTLGDQLRYATGNRSKVIAISGKDRGAILLAGKTGTAYMYMDKTGQFASSTYYMKAHPEWVAKYRLARPQDQYYGKSWRPLLPDAAYSGDAPDALYPATLTNRNKFPFAFFSESGTIDSDYFNRLKASPYLDELTFDFARATVEGEQLGKNSAGVTDVLGISLSAHDYINHAYGPESKMSHDHLQRIDRMLATFMNYLDRKVGKDDVMVVLTSDHGFPNTPEFAKANKGNAGRVESNKLVSALNAALGAKYGDPKLVSAHSAPNFYLDTAAIEKAGRSRAEVEQFAAQFLRKQDGIAEVFTRSQLESAVTSTARLETLVRRGWHRELSGDVMVVTKPYWFFGYSSTGTTHGSPYNYDTNVPLILSGRKWFKPAYSGQYAETVDIAPTLAHVLQLRPPAASEGRVLTEALRAP